MENRQDVEVLIVGAGPAGSVCGSLLLQAGIDCLLVDRATFPRDKICGGGLTIKAWRLLDQLLPGIQYEYRPINEHIILIGDAGGFANKLTGEGLYDAFKTAYHACQAIVEHKPFRETNREVFVKMERQKKVYQYFFSNVGFKLIRWGMRYPRVIKWLFDAKMKRESWIK